MKYEVSTLSIEFKGVRLFRIRALVDIPSKGVLAGDLGGYVQSRKNLAEYGSCWVSENAKVYDMGWVCDDAWVGDNAEVFETASVFGSSRVFDNARVFGKAWVFDAAEVSGNATVGGDFFVFGNTVISGNQVMR